MYTGTTDEKKVPQIVENFIQDGYKNIEVTYQNGQWIVLAK